MSFVTPPGVLSAQLPNPREHDPRSTRDLSVNDSAFSVVQYNFPAYNATTGQDSEWILASGTVLQVTELLGANSIGVRFEVNGPFLPVQEGDVVHARFERVQFRCFPTVNTTGATYLGNETGIYDVDVMAIASNGLRIDKAPRREGFTRGFTIWTGTATTAGINLLKAWDSMPASKRPIYDRPTPGKGGGQIVIKNTGSETIYLYNQPITLFSGNATYYTGSPALTMPSAKCSMPIDPGETIAIPLKSYCDSLCVATESGTSTFSVMADSTPDARVSGRVGL